MATEDKPSNQLQSDLMAALKEIAAMGGNLSDERLMAATGANDARHRGILFVNARAVARAALAKAEGRQS